MSPDRKEFLQVIGLPPARLNVQETAWYLGFMEHDIPVLIRAGLLKPLVRSPQAVKYFATITLARLREDPAWLAKASEAVTKHWRSKNKQQLAGRNGNPARLNNRSLSRTESAEELSTTTA